MKRNMMDLPIRRRMFHFVRSNPGVHFREILRELDLSIGQLDFHLNEMIKSEVITKDISMGNARFYVRDTFTKGEKAAMSFLRKEIPRTILLFIIDYPGSTPQAILENFDFTGPNLSYHLSRMIKAEVLEFDASGRERMYRVKDPDTIRSLLIIYRASLLDRLIDVI